MGIEIGSKATNAHHALPHNNRMHNVVSQVDSVLSMQYNHDNSSYTSLKHNPNEHLKKKSTLYERTCKYIKKFEPHSYRPTYWQK